MAKTIGSRYLSYIGIVRMVWNFADLLLILIKFFYMTSLFKSRKLFELINWTTLIFYILFSISKRLLNGDFMIIPFILFIANCLIIIEFAYRFFIKKDNDIEVKGWGYLFQFIINLGFAVYIYYYYLGF